MTPKARAEKATAALWAEDRASQTIGMEIAEVDAGRAVLTLTVQPEHCNGHGICHGGITFMLADSAFAFACNSRNQMTVAQHNSISYLAPGHMGDTLRAEASEVSLRGRSGLYDVTVTNQNGQMIAAFRGASRALKGTVFEE
ncbi:hydroxyphenylacetyl-CoA thioesterase PaaI [Shimia sp. MMG029]|uniref:hydroxyphenylacetyl-CoA thioesterase PaaI n=1 Tax=Shimia sp. MMG029 TaxID=3021978 RepID=UPI0022FE66F1|nr:hydroxyphenylacetyl-CoA thioesterase PaaI [Shimia sp. MMG029]MDA5555744.1 hydroxyphenylacetyl-CoA thioesterase PaaI [Shimia sp. MMG029]